MSIHRIVSVGAVIWWIIVACVVFGGCMTNKNTINAYEGSTVTQSIDQKKTVTTTTDANIPQSALGM